MQVEVVDCVDDTAYDLDDDEEIVIALAELGIGDEPNAQVLSECEEFICQLFSLKNQTFTESLEQRMSQF